MTTWIRNEDGGGWITAYTVTIDGHVFILTEREYDAVSEAAPELAGRPQAEQDAALRELLNIR